TLAIRGLRRPYRSASNPNTTAPTGRIARVAVMVHTIALFVTWNWAASVSTRKTSTKKSNASRVQPKKLAVTACHCSDREGGASDAGFDAEAVSLFLTSQQKSSRGSVHRSSCLFRTEAGKQGRHLASHLEASRLPEAAGTGALRT